MRWNRHPLVLGLALITLPALLPAQTAAEHVAMGIEELTQKFDPRAAMVHYEAALALDSMDLNANWRAAQALVDIGKQTPDSIKSAERDSMYARAERLARRAVEVDSTSSKAHYILSAAIGRASLTKSKKERVKRAAEIRSEALKAIELNPAEDGAYHVMGRWNAEIMRLSGLTRFFAKTFLGGAIFNEASWQGAIDNMNKAIEYHPDWIYHYLDLAEILIDREQYTAAREALKKVEELPVADAMDPHYKQDGQLFLSQIEGKKDKKQD